MPEPCGGGVDHSSDLGAAVAGTGAGFSRQPGFGGHQGQVGHGGCQVQLEPGFGTAEVGGLADSQLDQPRQPVLHHYAALPVLGKGLALLQARALGWEVVQLDPPRRASRHDGGMRSVNPDAFGVLRKGDTRWPFFLEWERRAVRPSTMSARLAPYLRYYSSHRPTDDHGTRPSVLVVFDDEIAHTHFLRVAREETHESRVNVPLWVSHREAVDALGPLGRAWRSSGDPESPQALPPQ